MKIRNAALLIFCLVAINPIITEVKGAEKAHEFTLTDIEGKEFSLSDFKGEYVLIDFWAIWCKPCELSLPHLKNLKSQLGEKINIISINIETEETIEQIREYKEKHDMDWIVAKDTEFLTIPYRVTALPTFVLIDPSGYIVNTYQGVTDESIIIQEIKLELSETIQSPDVEQPKTESPETLQPPVLKPFKTHSGIGILTFLIPTIAIIAIVVTIILQRRKQKNYEINVQKDLLFFKYRMELFI
ncbi:TlpA family protein disulfide reductase [[Eubacterium] cellulosolvens]